MVQKTRRELQRIFKSGAKPSSEDFKDFIESTLNITDDGLEKSAGANSPLKISAQGTQEKLLDFYVDEVKTWSISQRPSEDNPGFNLSNASGSKLFIADSNGNVGINTTSPSAQLEINGNLKLQSGVAVSEFSTDGTLAGNSDLVIPTEQAVKTYVCNYIESVVVTGMIVMWSGASNAIPTGWALCDGSVTGRPDLRDRFIMGAGANNNKTSGNATSHSHSMTVDQTGLSTEYAGTHYHNYPNGYSIWGRDGGKTPCVATEMYNMNSSLNGRPATADGGSHRHEIDLNFSASSSAYGEIRPKWYALCFIIRL